MTVKELREKLAALPEDQQDLPVWCADYNGELAPVDELAVDPEEHGYPAMARLRG